MGFILLTDYIAQDPCSYIKQNLLLTHQWNCGGLYLQRIEKLNLSMKGCDLRFPIVIFFFYFNYYTCFLFCKINLTYYCRSIQFGRWKSIPILHSMNLRALTESFVNIQMTGNSMANFTLYATFEYVQITKENLYFWLGKNSNILLIR